MINCKHSLLIINLVVKNKVTGFGPGVGGGRGEGLNNFLSLKMEGLLERGDPIRERVPLEI